MGTVAVSAAGETVSVTYGTSGKVVYGSNPGGWSVTTKLETGAQALARIDAAWHPPAWRWWSSGNQVNWAAMPSQMVGRRVVAEIGLTATDTQMIATCQSCPNDGVRRYVSLCHEPESKTDPATYQAAWARFAAIHLQYSPPNLRTVLVLMGASFIPARQASVGGHTWDEWWPTNHNGINALGADVYQWMTDVGTTVLSPVISAAASYNLDLVIAELGAHRVSPPYSPGLTDAASAQFLTDATGLLDGYAAKGHEVTALYFESDNGNATMVPWALLPPPDGSITPYRPLGAAVWAAACARA